MRRTIRLTGRRQLPVSCVDVKVRDVGKGRAVALGIVDHQAFKGISQSARVTLRLVQDKQMELLDFGTLGALKSVVDLENPDFGDPSCQLRIASTTVENHGILLASTKTWRLSSDRPQNEGGVRGILRFQPSDIAPRAWKLDIQENSHPLVEIDKRIPDPKNWAKTNPVFVAAVLPAILSQVFDDILDQPSPSDTEWMSDWLRWADGLMPACPPPNADSARNDKRSWIEMLIDTFCQRHRLSDQIVDSMIAMEAA